VSSRIFVAGATGVLGRRAVPALVDAGHLVTANVRSDDARRLVESYGAAATTVDLFDPEATRRLGDDHDTIVNIATAIPTGASAARRSGWAINDRLRTEAADNLAAAVARPGGRYVGESITFPYVDRGDDWIDERVATSYFWGNESSRRAEAAAASVTAAGGVGTALRFAMFFADDSAHVATFRTVAKGGVLSLPGAADGYFSWVHVDDAAAAVVAAVEGPAGLFNVAEPEPARRADHAAALAAALGRRSLRLIPSPVARAAGAGLTSLARSQRISSDAFASATGWEPRRRVVDAWGG
jgi:nucleoside-diphosphate-sugar epimerase